MHSLLIVLAPLLLGAASPERPGPAASSAPATQAITPEATTTQVTTATPATSPAATATPEATATATATAAPSPAVGSSQTAGKEPWYTLYRGTRFGVGLDVGAPAGAGLVGIFRPWWWLRTNAGLAYDVLGFGVRGGVSLVPVHWAVTPSFNLDFGHFFSGDAAKFVDHPTPTQKSLLGQATFDFISPQLGLEFGSQRRFAFYVRGGLTYIGNMSFAAKDVAAEANAHTDAGTWGGSGNLAVRALLPSFSLGFNLFLD
jgi:hypothetical protein